MERRSFRRLKKEEYRPLSSEAERALRNKFRLFGTYTKLSSSGSVTPGVTADGKNLQNEKPRWNWWNEFNFNSLILFHLHVMFDKHWFRETYSYCSWKIPSNSTANGPLCNLWSFVPGKFLFALLLLQASFKKQYQKKTQTRQNQQKRTYYGVVPERGLQVALTVM